MRPLKNAIADVKAQVTDFFAGVILDRYGIDVEQFELLTSLGAKLDVKSVRVGDTVVPIFKPADREKLHYYMGITDAQVDLINLPLDAVPGVEFYPDAAGNFGDNIEYDKDKFLAFRNALQLSKMLLLQETDPLGAVSLEQLSKLMNDGLAAANQPATYDWSKLNVWGAHGGSILTTTLPKPAERTEIVSVNAASDVITVAAGSTLKTGDPVRYRPGALDAGLGLNTTYYVQKLSDTTLVLFEDVTDAHVLVPAKPRVDLDAGDGQLLKRIIADISKLAFPDGLREPTGFFDYFTDERPWLKLIDGDKVWRENNLSVTNALFRLLLQPRDVRRTSPRTSPTTPNGSSQCRTATTASRSRGCGTCRSG